ncbi:glycosyltransferase family 4 protein [Rhodopseudomonas boonkerdii]|uniref:MraY family glycosyltransferase n=1 Tax=Rhodopseudomonas boonkerdii TaxID=475937 RepID=UPI001E2C06E6|nr:glycosyltransferase family 4 protein [Rhodopseudomonas boonkerdii]UGV25905.1 glycosyltransferase family 4 protein [Rhodopseudomonas boonkerdii]
MSSTELIVLSAALAAAVLARLCIQAIHPLLIRYALARPNARSSHKIPTPQGAGIAVIAATLFVAGVAIAWFAAITAMLWVLFAATIVIAVVGAADDLRPLPVAPRFALQALCVAATLSALPADLQILPVLPLWLERAALLIGGLWFVNLTNFMDGLDWITVAEIVPVTATLALMGLSGALSLPAALMAAALCGAMLGFAPFNRPVAKMFLGDVGSLPIGLLLAWCLLQLAFAGHLVAAVLLPLYYLCDATVTLLRRMARSEPFWLAHRSHFYQRATDNGFTVIEVSGNILALNVVLAALAGLSIYLESAPASIGLLIVGIGATAALLRRFATPRT